MRFYRCYFFKDDDAPAGVRTFQCEDDGEARDQALGLLVGYPRAVRVEVWENLRRTLSYSRPAAQTPADLRKLCYLAIAAAKKESDPEIKRVIASRAAALAQEAESMERRATFN